VFRGGGATNYEKWQVAPQAYKILLQPVSLSLCYHHYAQSSVHTVTEKHTEAAGSGMV
jgi:hypothetical protein